MFERLNNGGKERYLYVQQRMNGSSRTRKAKGKDRVCSVGTRRNKQETRANQGSEPRHEATGEKVARHEDIREGIHDFIYRRLDQGGSAEERRGDMSRLWISTHEQGSKVKVKGPSGG